MSLFFSPEVQSILNLSPPQDAEIMNTNPSPPVSIFALCYTELNAEICPHILCVHDNHTFCGSYKIYNVLILFCAPLFTAQSISTD